eukprot:CAMPEP_0170510098 /NCGR_PEP_ID=MMETSP0208-20121228/65581_1 /TAXON_ID=197538 /ORGANISM="Strombidium inclinatum, Strain S3" /LENGTH=79 /DNA_ID=CAMNT_0010793527 /DNA_START=358 /DNA_END=597 /DNA_ORIENTATION=-
MTPAQMERPLQAYRSESSTSDLVPLPVDRREENLPLLGAPNSSGMPHHLGEETKEQDGFQRPQEPGTADPFLMVNGEPA